MKIREIVILTLGALGFCSQIVAQFTGRVPDYRIMLGSLALLGVVPILRLDERGHKREERS